MLHTHKFIPRAGQTPVASSLTNWLLQQELLSNLAVEGGRHTFSLKFICLHSSALHSGLLDSTLYGQTPLLRGTGDT